MFTKAEQVMLGYSTRVAVNAQPNIAEVMMLTKKMVNSPSVIARFESLFPQAAKVAAESEFHVFVSFADDLAAAGYPVPATGFYCGMAELRAYGRGGQIQITVSSDVSETEVVNMFIHEARHLEDLLTGDLIVNTATGVITWKGVEYQSIPMAKIIAKPDETHEQAVRRFVAAAQYYAQPWEHRANEGLWKYEFRGARQMIENYGVTWLPELDEEAVVEHMLQQIKPNLYIAVKELLER